AAAVASDCDLSSDSLLRFLRSEPFLFSRFFFNDTATTEIYTLSLHDALPISKMLRELIHCTTLTIKTNHFHFCNRDRKSTRLNSSHANISYAVFCLKKKK